MNRVEQIAADMFDFGGALYTVTKLSKFLGCSFDTAANIAVKAPVAFGQNTGKRYYYRDLAAIIANGK